LSNATSGELCLEYLQETKWTFLHDDLFHGTTAMDLREYLLSLSATELQVLIDKPDRRGRTPLALAVEYCWTAPALILLEFGADVNQRQYSMNGTSIPLLHLAIAGEGHIQDMIEITQLMITHGADVNGTDDEGWTPLHIAASWHQLDTIKLLAEVPGLDWHARTTDNKNALDLARDANDVPNDDIFPHVEAFLVSHIANN
jgi:ankyrin repeat protein